MTTVMIAMNKDDSLLILKESKIPAAGSNRGVVTVIGKDKVGIIAGISRVLAEKQANIADISQTILKGLFTMNMIVDLSNLGCTFQELSSALEVEAQRLGVKVYIHREEVFDFMHSI